MGFVSRLQHAWNAFNGREFVSDYSYPDGYSWGTRPDRITLNLGNERSIVSSVLTRIAIDVASVNIYHVRTNQNGRYEETIDSGLNNCLTLSANIDQTGRAFIQDTAMSLFDEGSIAIVPVDTTINPNVSGSYDIQTLRVGQILEWFPKYVRVRVYNDRKGIKEDIILSKEIVAIVENPLYAVMNEPNSTLKRLVRKLNLLDAIDEQSGSGKLDIILQLPYVAKSESRKAYAEQRRKEVENQLAGSKYGIAYMDGTERITQLNRPAENNLLQQIEYLTNMLYSQLGLTPSVFDGTADEKVMLNYYSRTVEPVVSAIVDSMKRTFLTKTARSQGQSIMYFNDPFKLTPVNDIAEIADKFTRNEILSSNEVRAIIGYKPDKDPRADELRNKNLNAGNDQLPKKVTEGDPEVMKEKNERG